MERRLFTRTHVTGTTLKYKKVRSKRILSTLSRLKKVANISCFGLAFHCAEPMKSGEKLYLKVNFPTGKSLRLKGNILWQCDLNSGSIYEVGVRLCPFGTTRKYNPLSALEYLREMNVGNV